MFAGAPENRALLGSNPSAARRLYASIFLGKVPPPVPFRFKRALLPVLPAVQPVYFLADTVLRF
jgi:hypothetical protein